MVSDTYKKKGNQYEWLQPHHYIGNVVYVCGHYRQVIVEAKSETEARQLFSECTHRFCQKCQTTDAEGVSDIRNCPVQEKTADGIPVGRCWFFLEDGKTCPRHGDVSGLLRKKGDSNV